MLTVESTLDMRTLSGVAFVYEVRTVKLFGFTVFTTQRYIDRY